MKKFPHESKIQLNSVHKRKLKGTENFTFGLNCSYALLTHMIAHVTGLSAGEFVHTLGDAHVYNNHFDALKEQVTLRPCAFEFVRSI